MTYETYFLCWAFLVKGLGFFSSFTITLEWDSLEHINLIDAVEQEFHMQFQMKEVSGMKNVGEMADIVANRATEKPKKRGLFRR